MHTDPNRRNFSVVPGRICRQSYTVVSFRFSVARQALFHVEDRTFPSTVVFQRKSYAADELSMEVDKTGGEKRRKRKEKEERKLASTPMVHEGSGPDPPGSSDTSVYQPGFYRCFSSVRAARISSSSCPGLPPANFEIVPSFRAERNCR